MVVTWGQAKYVFHRVQTEGISIEDAVTKWNRDMPDPIDLGEITEIYNKVFNVDHGRRPQRVLHDELEKQQYKVVSASEPVAQAEPDTANKTRGRWKRT